MDESKKLCLKNSNNISLPNNKISFYLLANNINKGNRIFYFDWLRIISSFSVIMIHSSFDNYIKYSINSYEWKISYYYNGLSRWGVPIFFMLSGALFLKKDISIKSIFNKYIKKLVISLLFWSSIYSLINIKEISAINIKKLILRIIVGRLFLWYIYAIIGLYIITPILRQICKNDIILKYYLIVSFLFTFIIPIFNYFLLYLSKDIYDSLNYINNKLNLHYIKGNIFYFVFGYYLYNNNLILLKYRILIYILGIFGILFTTVLSYNISIKKNKKIEFYDNENLNNMLTATSLFVFFKHNFNNLKINKKKNNIIIEISKYTFGIYLIHILIRENVISKFENIYLPNKLIYKIPLISIINFILSLLICIFIKKIPKIGLYLI